MWKGASPAERARELKLRSSSVVPVVPSSDVCLPAALPAASAACDALTLVEFACSDDSSLGTACSECNVDSVRLTRRVTDLSVKAGLDCALSAIDVPNEVHLWGSLPCTPWTIWQRLNCATLGPEFVKKLSKQRRTSIIMLRHFIIVASKVLAKGGHVSF